MDLNWITVWLNALVTQVPTLLTALAICAWVLARREQLGPAFLRALLGFGLLLVVALLAPVAQVMVQQWASSHYVGVKQVVRIYTILGFLWSALSALAFLFVALAIFAGRRVEGVDLPPPLSKTRD